MFKVTEKITATTKTIRQLDELMLVRAKQGHRIMSHMELVAALVNSEAMKKVKQ